MYVQKGIFPNSHHMGMRVGIKYENRFFRNCCIIFFFQLTTILVVALVKTIAEAMSDNREILGVFHQIISSEFKVIASALFYCIRFSTPLLMNMLTYVAK